jgi:hypothetical protein
MKLDPIMGKIGGEEDTRIKSMFTKNKKNKLFTESRTMFNTPKNKLFRYWSIYRRKYMLDVN